MMYGNSLSLKTHDLPLLCFLSCLQSNRPSKISSLEVQYDRLSHSAWGYLQAKPWLTELQGPASLTCNPMPRSYLPSNPYWSFNIIRECHPEHIYYSWCTIPSSTSKKGVIFDVDRKCILDFWCTKYYDKLAAVNKNELCLFHFFEMLSDMSLQ